MAQPLVSGTDRTSRIHAGLRPCDALISFLSQTKPALVPGPP